MHLKGASSMMRLGLSVETTWLAVSCVQGPFLGYNRLAFLEGLNWNFVNWWVWLESHE